MIPQEMYRQVGNPLSSKGMVLRQELGKGESLPEGLLFLWGGGGDGEVFAARLAGN